MSEKSENSVRGMGSGASKPLIACPVCDGDDVMMSKKDFVAHFRKEHNRVCTKCGLSGFETEESMYQHYDIVHNESKSSAEKIMNCPMCDATFTKEQKFLEHMSAAHSFQYHSKDGKKFKCPKCGQTKDTAEKLDKHLQKNHFLKCPTCGKTGFQNQDELSRHAGEVHSAMQSGTSIACSMNSCEEMFSAVDDFIQHLSDNHNFSFVVNKKEIREVEKRKCPKCEEVLCYKELVEHMEKLHIKLEGGVDNMARSQAQFPEVQPSTSDIVCPRCSEKTVFYSSEDLVQHLSTKHNFSSNVDIRSPADIANIANIKKRLPKIGDRILAMWSQSLWQYFHATIREVMGDLITYEIDWDDGDTTGRFVEYKNIAVDRVPDETEIGTGSIILFPQGNYKAGNTQLTGGKRWHQGRITKVYKGVDGALLYDGHHTKGQSDGKFTTFRDYSYEFIGFARSDIRVGPNVFDILEEKGNDLNLTLDNIDIYFSHASNQVTRSDEDADPIIVASNLKSKGLTVINSGEMASNVALNKKVAMMKNSKVFVACISNDYVEDETCRMEFQFAKSTLRKPVVPLVFGGGMDWQLSVVGMLISGELYIHLRDKTVQAEKIEDILRSISAHIDIVEQVVRDGTNSNNNNNVVKQADDVFLSYCWSNSHMADQAKQIKRCVGNQYNDPRLIKENLAQVGGFNTWLDIEQLKSGDQGVGLFEQLAAALKNTKVFMPCISDEYAASANCRMEFQFACKALKKPAVPLIVGSGNNWTETVVGMLVKTDENIHPVDLRNVNTKEELDAALQGAFQRITALLGDGNHTNKIRTKKPKVGDHVVSHHFTHCYYMATVASYDASTMEYTVNWDDGDPSGRVQPYNQVALDEVPDIDDVGVGSIIFFPQGAYKGSEGNNTGGMRYHEGVITKVTIVSAQNALISGHHTRGQSDGKFLGYRNYAHEFQEISLQEIRLAASALDTME